MIHRVFKLITMIVLVPAFGCCGCGVSLESTAWANDTIQKCRVDARAGDKTSDCCYVLEIKGMSCESCAEHVATALRQVPGVVDAKVVFRDSQAKVHPKPGSRLKGDALVKAVEKAGYRAKIKESPKP